MKMYKIFFLPLFCLGVFDFNFKLTIRCRSPDALRKMKRKAASASDSVVEKAVRSEIVSGRRGEWRLAGKTIFFGQGPAGYGGGTEIRRGTDGCPTQKDDAEPAAFLPGRLRGKFCPEPMPVSSAGGRPEESCWGAVRRGADAVVR